MLARSLFIGLSATLSSALVQTIAEAQQPECDAGLRSPTENRYAYGPRGDRCEGVYVKQVGGTVLAIASLTSTFEKYNPDSVKNLRFSWSARADSGIRIRVRGIQPNLYYGMDAVRPPGASSYSWPTAILSSLRITRQDIGALAWTRRSIGGGLQTVYVPLRISKSDTSAPAAGYVLVLFPGVKIQEVYVSLAPADSLGQPKEGNFVFDHQPQNQGYYPAERPIRIKIPPLDPPGLYVIEVSATLPNGSPVGVDPILIDVSGR